MFSASSTVPSSPSTTFLCQFTPKITFYTKITFENNTTVFSLKTNNNEATYVEEEENLMRWSDENNMILKTRKTKQINFKFLCVNMTDNLFSIEWKSEQSLYFLK